MEFLHRNRSDYYDLLITQFGINREGEKFKTIRLYAFSNVEGQYIMISQHQIPAFYAPRVRLNRF